MALLVFRLDKTTIQTLQLLSKVASRFDDMGEIANQYQATVSAGNLSSIENVQSKEKELIASNLNLLQNIANQTSHVNNISLGENIPTSEVKSVQSLPDDLLARPFATQYTLAQQCRLEIEKWANAVIDEFLEMGEAMPPLLDWVWDMGDYFLINMKFSTYFKWSEYAFLGATWNWQDQFGNNFTIDQILGNYGKRYTPLMLIKVPPFNESHQTEQSIPVFLWASNVRAPENKTVHPWTYDLRPYIKCDRIEINDDRPRPGTKIGMCVRFRGGHHLIPPFIAYHRLIGVDHFWLYANEEFNITDLPQASDVTYVPYRFVWQEHINHSRVEDENGVVKHWRLPIAGSDYWQPQSMQQCLYRAKRYGLDWIMTNDIDEYLWINKTVSNQSSAVHNVSMLHDFLLPYEDGAYNDVGGLAVEGWAFGANESSSETLEFPIDYVYRAQEMTGGRRKIIYRAPIAEAIDIHWLRRGGKLIYLPPSDIRWNHYRRPQEGIFQRGRRPIVMDSSLRDTYRAAMVESMKNDIYPHDIIRNAQSKYL